MGALSREERAKFIINSAVFFTQCQTKSTRGPLKRNPKQYPPPNAFLKGSESESLRPTIRETLRRLLRESYLSLHTNLRN